MNIISIKLGCIEMKFEHIQKKLEGMLSPCRFEHSERVAKEAAALAACNHLDEEKAFLAGLLHDCLRDFPLEKMSSFLPPWVGWEIWSIPAIHHAFAAPAFIREVLGVKDFSILRAICWHATACETMGKFDKLLFVADICEPGRTFEEARKIRDLAYNNLDQAYFYSLKVKLKYLVSGGKIIYPATLRAWNVESRKWGIEESGNFEKEGKKTYQL